MPGGCKHSLLAVHGLTITITISISTEQGAHWCCLCMHHHCSCGVPVPPAAWSLLPNMPSTRRPSCGRRHKGSAVAQRTIRHKCLYMQQRCASLQQLPCGAHRQCADTLSRMELSLLLGDKTYIETIHGASIQLCMAPGPAAQAACAVHHCKVHNLLHAPPGGPHGIICFSMHPTAHLQRGLHTHPSSWMPSLTRFDHG